MGLLGGAGEPNKISEKLRRIGTSDFLGCIDQGLVWISGPCGLHCLSFHNASELGSWLMDQTAVTMEGEAEDVTGKRLIGFGT